MITAYYEHWKIIFDYCCWIRDGGEMLYGDIAVAEAWCASLLAAATAML